ncbi:MAG: type II toxin-antitoxin system prevent-host-death family antitoxin [Hahellaceae bacterium]|nr:type II toxin-antitoxin system prevent-host-death family antitoxin [Hahellaceae bacterium]
MIEINVKEARQRLSELLDKVQSGEVVMLTRHGEPSALLVKPVAKPRVLPSMSAFRNSLGKVSQQSSTDLLREDRDAR